MLNLFVYKIMRILRQASLTFLIRQWGQWQREIEKVLSWQWSRFLGKKERRFQKLFIPCERSRFLGKEGMRFQKMFLPSDPDFEEKRKGGFRKRTDHENWERSRFLGKEEIRFQKMVLPCEWPRFWGKEERRFQ